MASIIHTALIVTGSGETIARVRKDLLSIAEVHQDSIGRHLQVTPLFAGVANSAETFMVAPDNSKDTFSAYDKAQATRGEMKVKLREYGSSIDWVEVQYGTPDVFETELIGPYAEIRDARGYAVECINDDELTTHFAPFAAAGTMGAIRDDVAEDVGLELA